MPPQCKMVSSPTQSSSFTYQYEDDSSGSCDSHHHSSEMLELQRKESCKMEAPVEQPVEPWGNSKATATDNKNTASSSESPSTTTNEYVLNVAFYSFLGFVVFQSVFAMIAHSQSMMADSEAMFVDAMTYLFNLGAEKLKHRPLTDYELALPVPQRLYRRALHKLYLELVPPMISVAILFGVTVLTMYQAIQTIALEASEEHVDDDVSVPIMFFFSAGNLTLDVINMTCFARTSTNMSIASLDVSRVPVKTATDDQYECRTWLPRQQQQQQQQRQSKHLESDAAVNELSPLIQLKSRSRDEESFEDIPNDATTAICTEKYGDSLNLNMFSAYTHIFADTLRSFAVLFVAAVATCVPSIRPEQADAVAAIAVSLVIFATLVPLIRGLWTTFSQIVHLHRHPWSMSC